MEQVSDLSLFNELFTIYKGRFVRFAQTFTRDATIAEDIVIDSLIYLLKRERPFAQHATPCIRTLESDYSLYL